MGEAVAAALGGALAGVAPGWLAAGVVLHLANQVMRGGGWYAVVRAAVGADPRLRRRDTMAVWVAGAAAGGLAARAGDAVRVLLMARRLPGAGCPLLAGTLAAEGAGELAVGAGLVAVALTVGVGPELDAPGAPALVAAGLLAAAGVLAAALSPRVRRVARRAGQGCAALRSPAAYARGVLPWQVASRACRLAALACFLVAFGLPAVPAAVLLVVFAQTGGRLLPFGPASVGAGVAVLAASFGAVTGTAVPAGQLAAFFVGTSTLLTVVGLALAVPICLRTAGLGPVLRTVQESARQGRRGLAGGAPARATSLPAP
jgi:hypothetical protein